VRRGLGRIRTLESPPWTSAQPLHLTARCWIQPKVARRRNLARANLDLNLTCTEAQ